MYYRRAVFTAAILFAVSLSAHASTRVLPGFQDKPSEVGFQIVDSRAKDDRTSEILSYWVTSCNYGIYRIGDEQTSPTKLVLLRRNLEDALGTRLKGTTLTVTRYRMHVNKRAILRQQVSGNFTGVVPAMLDSAGEGCTKEETKAGWFDASEVTTSFPPMIIEIEAMLNGKTYSLRFVYSSQGKDIDDNGIPVLFDAMQKANAALGEQLAPDLPAQ